MRRRTLSIVAAVAVLAAGAAVAVPTSRGRVPMRTPARMHRPSWPPLRTARAFFLEDLRDKIDGNWAAAWRTLYPAHRLIVSRREFVSCERARPLPARLHSLRVVAVRKALVRVPGRSRPVAGVAVDVHVELEWYGPRDPIVFRHTFHLVPADGSWTRLLSPSRYRLYREQGCNPALVS